MPYPFHLGTFTLGLHLVQAGWVGLLSFTTQRPDWLTRATSFLLSRTEASWELRVGESCQSLWAALEPSPSSLQIWMTMLPNFNSLEPEECPHVSLISFPVTFDSETDSCPLWSSCLWFVLRVSEALSDLCLKGLRDCVTETSERTLCQHLSLPDGAREAPSQGEGQDREGQRDCRAGWHLSCLPLNTGGSQKHTQWFVNSTCLC